MNNTIFEGDIKFSWGFEAAQAAYKKLTWLERLRGKPFGKVVLKNSNEKTCVVRYLS